jgi:serine/threonine protein kinase
MIKRYEDFEIDITQQGGQLYADLKAAPGDRNLARPIPITLPDDHVAWTEAYQGRKDRTELAELGHRLFESLITGKLADNWNACRGEVHQQPDTGLRLRFSTQADVLTQVPLELLCIRTEPTSEFLALHTLTPVVRSPRSGKPVEKRPITPPLRMLVIIANPKLQEPIDPVAEQASLEEALADIIRTGNLKIDYLGPPGCHRADYTTLHHTLARADPPYNIVHFIGHGALDDDTKEEGLLLLVDSQTGLRRDIYASDLACLLAPNGVRVAVLQACDSARAGRHSTFMGLAQRLIAEGLPAAMAMQYRVDQDIATRFCGQFYHFWLAEGGLPIERALTEARQDVHHRFRDRATAWWTPTLFIRVPSSEVLRVDIGEQSFRTTLYLDLGEALLLSGQIDEAIAKLREAYEKVPDRVSSILTRALVAQAKVREDNGDVDGALVSYEQALKVSPDDQTAQMGKASLLAQYSEMEKEQDRSQPSETASKDWQPGHKLGDGEYEIVEELATTECYIVYRAKELQFNSTVVIKRLKSEKQINERDYQRFKREVAVLKHFLRHIEQHGAVVLRFFGSGKTEAGDRYFVTEFADKGSLKDYLEGRPHNRLSSSEALKIAKAICQGIDAIHGLGIVHRDIKPGNIFLFSGSSGGVRATLADFSIARIPKKWSIENVTIPGMFMGTPRYAAPEQISGSTGPQSDLYSWGLVFFEMLTGEPFLGESPFEVLLSEDEPSLHFFSEKGIPLSFAEILQKTLRKDRKHRYKSAGEILKALDSIQSPTVKDIEQRLRIGEECIEASKWREAGTELERGLELCQWYGEPDKLSGRLGELAHRLEAGYLCVQGTIEKSERQWQAAVDAFEALLRLYPTYPCIDVAAELREAYAGRQDDVAKRKLYDPGQRT